MPSRVIIVLFVLHLLLWLLVASMVRRADMERLIRFLRPALLIGLCLLAVYPCLRRAAPIARFHIFSPRSLLFNYPDEWTLIEKSGIEIYETIGDLRHRAVPDDLVLTFRQSDIAFYGKCRWISDFDTRLTDVYRSQSSAEAFRRLREKGIRYIFLPYYYPPTLCNTPLGDLVGDPAYCKVLDNHGEFRLLQLNDAVDSDADERSKIVLEDTSLFDWTIYSYGKDAAGLSNFCYRKEVDGKARLIIVNPARDPLYLFSGSGERLRAPGTIFQRNLTFVPYRTQAPAQLNEVFLAAHMTPSETPEQFSNPRLEMWTPSPELKHSLTHRVRARVGGRGHFKIWVYQYFRREHRQKIDRILAYDGLLTEEPRIVTGQFLSVDQDAPFRVVFEVFGRSNMRLHGVAVTEVSPPADSAEAPPASQDSL